MGCEEVPDVRSGDGMIWDTYWYSGNYTVVMKISEQEAWDLKEKGHTIPRGTL